MSNALAATSRASPTSSNQRSASRLAGSCGSKDAVSSTAWIWEEDETTVANRRRTGSIVKFTSASTNLNLPPFRYSPRAEKTVQGTEVVFTGMCIASGLVTQRFVEHLEGHWSGSNDVDVSCKVDFGPTENGLGGAAPSGPCEPCGRLTREHAAVHCGCTNFLLMFPLAHPLFIPLYRFCQDVHNHVNRWPFREMTCK